MERRYEHYASVVNAETHTGLHVNINAFPNMHTNPKC
jgi:hypothetical protein